MGGQTHPHRTVEVTTPHFIIFPISIDSILVEDPENGTDVK